MIPLSKPLLALLLLCAGAADAMTERQLENTFTLDEDQILRIEISVARLEIRATDRRDVHVDLGVRCRWQLADCEDAVEDMEILPSASSRRLTLELTGFSPWYSPLIEVEGTIEIPVDSRLEVEMGVADLRILDIENHARIDLDIGELRLRMPASALGEALIDVGIGRAEISGTDLAIGRQRSHLLGNRIRWDDGPGSAEIEIELGIGEASVRLEDSPSPSD